MGLSKVYRGYVIEDVNGQWYIHNAPNYLNGVPFSPGPHNGWTVATHQVDKLLEYINRGNQQLSGWSTQSNGGSRHISSYDYEYEPPSKLQKIVGAIFLFGLFWLCVFLYNL